MRWAAAVVLSASLLAACGGGDANNSAKAQSSDARARATAAVAPAAVAADEIKVVDLIKVSETRVSRTEFDVVFQVRLRNTGSHSWRDVSLTLSAVGAGATIRDGAVVVGNVGASAELTPADTITLRQDRTKSFDIASLVWQVSGTASDTPADQLAALEDSGAIPKLERGPTIGGVDADGNGVRDDVDAWIASRYPAGVQRAAAVQAARALQASLLVNPQDLPAAKEASRRITYAANCVFTRFPAGGAIEPSRVMRELEGVTTNTKPRLLAYLAYNKALDGTSAALPEGDTCE
ncbi:hypothetical protein CDN99_12935 [Roseateles aquatilis]|uniref:Lipoprotein n=1 Tax=Roseateles aquatilis TaxID=431061 RepID=A0A246JCG2_9BURK|nr:hypothetical protein CDN99_12935 [Roseateles aquatilis]